MSSHAWFSICFDEFQAFVMKDRFLKGSYDIIHECKAEKMMSLKKGLSVIR